MFLVRKKTAETAYTTNIAGLRLYYRVAGQGPPLVLIHGYGTSGYTWQRVLPYLSQSHEVFIVDLPGHGRSTAARSWQLRAVAPLLGEWLQTLQLPPMALMGHSMGGAIAIHLTALAPVAIEKLVLVDAVGLPLQGPLPLLALRSTYSMFQPGNGGYPPEMIRDVLQPHFRMLWQTTRELLRSDLRSELALISIPTLIIWGERDAILPIAVGHALSAALPHASFVSMPGCGHRPMLARPERFCEIVEEFLRQK